MSRIPQPRADRGSQRWLQDFVARQDRRLEEPILSETKAQSIEWLSPLKDDDFAEYRDASFLELVGLGQFADSLGQFWPQRGPVWDGLAITNTGTVILVEAKAHIGEMDSSLAATSERSISLINRSLSATAEALGSEMTPAWTEGLYQYANRLAHLHFIRSIKGADAALVFVYFTGDADAGGPDSPEEWSAAVGRTRASLGLQHGLPAVVDVIVDVRDSSTLL